MELQAKSEIILYYLTNNLLFHILCGLKNFFTGLICQLSKYETNNSATTLVYVSEILCDG